MLGANKVKIGLVLRLLAVAASIFLVSFASFKLLNSTDGLSEVVIGGSAVEVEIAQTLPERQQGLSGKVGLKEDRGMFFIFDQPGLHGFWMKDMNFSIDIIWISDDKKVVYVEENVSPNSYPQVYRPSVPAKYVLEMLSGYAANNNIAVGENVDFDFD